VNPCYVSLCAQLLRLTNVKVCTVVGFPLGANRPETKAFETGRAIADGAQEIDMVANIGAMKSRDYALVESDVRGVVGVRLLGLDPIATVALEGSFGSGVFGSGFLLNIRF
jgi:deoxyribose-phosphate aldolase